MKIFNWVQKRFHHNVLKDGLARNVKKTDSIAIDSNTKALLEQAALSDVLDGWRDGILTIGTFGFDPLKSSAQRNNFLPLGCYDDDEEEEEEEERYADDNNYDDEEDGDVDDDNNGDEEVNPLMLSTFEHSLLEDVDSNVDNGMMMMIDGVVAGPTTTSTDHENEIKFDFEGSEGHSGKLRRRTTLAELFSEDLDIRKKPCSSPLELDSNPCKKQPSVRTKNGLSFAKKLIPQVGEDSRPIKMLHQMMRRMLKRKIHPELQGKSNKSEASVIEAPATKPHEAAEFVSLLQSPDAAIA